MAININFHGVTRIELSEIRHYATSHPFWARAIRIICSDGSEQEIGLYSDSENALDLVDPAKPAEIFKIDDDEPSDGSCPNCAGTGEGLHEGATCICCNGRGE